MAHASTFPPTGRSEGWSRSVAVNMTGAFEILSIDPEKRRIGVALVQEGSARTGEDAPSRAGIRPGARPTGTMDAQEAEEVREYTERKDDAPAEGFGSLADKLRGALKPREQ